MYECFHCGAKAVIWLADYDSEDDETGKKGIVHLCHCANCGANITYEIFLDDKDSSESDVNASTDDTNN